MSLPSAPIPMESDEQLWLRTRQGDPEAFGRLVSRYQSMVCAVAYSRCGDLARSEEIAQESFLAAWRQRESLREPSRLKAWLAGITRNLAHGRLRRERHGGATFLPIETIEAGEVPPVSSAGEDPSGELVSKEEAKLLWRALEGLPESYREPLVLFYREGRSVSEVAQSLDLSEDAVRQRLSRGRSQLREGLARVLERTLERTGPSGIFTAGVLAALSSMTAPSAEASTATVSGLGFGASHLAGKGATAALKGGVGGLGLGSVFGPLAGLAVGGVSARLLTRFARSPQERNCILWHAWGMTLFCFLMSLVLAGTLGLNGRAYRAATPGVLTIITVWFAVLLGILLALNARMNRRVLRMREAAAR